MEKIMTTKSKENKDFAATQKAAQEALTKVQTSINRLVDDIHTVKTEMAQFKSAVTTDIQRLVELREKDIDEIRQQYTK